MATAERIAKLLRMAHQTVSPREAAVARHKLEQLGAWQAAPPPPLANEPPIVRTWQNVRSTPTRDEAEELRRWKEAREEWLAGRPEKFYEETYRAFMEGFYGEAQPLTGQPRR